MEASLIESLGLVEMPIFARHPEVRSHSNRYVKNLFMLCVRIFSYGCTREMWRVRKMRKRVARGAAKSNSSFLNALQTSQVHP